MFEGRKCRVCHMAATKKLTEKIREWLFEVWELRNSPQTYMELESHGFGVFGKVMKGTRALGLVPI